MTDKVVKVLDLDIPNANGRIYPTSEVEKTLAEVKLPLMGTLGMPEDDKISITKVSHAVSELYIQDGALFAKVTVLQTPAGVMLSHLLDTCEFRPTGTGVVSKDGVVSDWKITSISAVDKGTAA